MKKIIATLGLTVLLSACASDGQLNMNQAMQMGNGAIKMYVQNQCTTELQSRNEWRLAALAMSQTQQQEWENKICGCVSEEAPNQLSATELLQLSNESTRSQVIANVTAKTVSACYQRLFHK